jgi:hypothetical protein
MINNNMIHLAATTHQAELRRVASGQHRWADRSGGTSPVSRLSRAVLRRLYTKAAGPAPNGTVSPRVAI